MGVLKRIATMAGWTVLRTSQSVADLVWLVVMPIAFGVIISLILAGAGAVKPPRAVVVNEDGTETVERLIRALATTPFDVQLAGRDEAMKQIAGGHVETALVVPAGFAASIAAGAPRLEVLQAGGSAGGLLVTRAKAIAAALARGEALPETLVAIETPRPTGDASPFTRVRVVFGVYLLFGLTASIQRTAALHRERKAGLLQRVLSTGVPYGEVIAAFMASIFLIGLLQAAVVLAVTGLLGTPWLAAGPGAIALPVLGSLFAGSGLAVALSGFVRSEAQVQLLGSAPPLLAVLGGAVMPLELTPAGVQKLAVFNPFYWAMEALEGGFVYRGWESQAGPLAVLLLVGVVGMVVGVQALRRRAV
ncbi:ABC transporter permease [Carboxydochorda subterranea]|uniref:ABC transporter permease n=1 Tax=Carboxydichorda subterranea TaxID=3109565 RepID=A0ABZ1BX67_9FIRM|nr:ABC transporter permease [Limnochorda sp. L945t]WRP17404.1 ABC transporter permease [Limnochorda sp. L945t]